MNSLRWRCSSPLTQTQDGFYCRIITTEIDSHFISNSTRETQLSHFTRTQGRTLWKEEMQDRACTSIYLIETLWVMLWLGLWPQRMSAPSPLAAHHTGCFTSPAQFATKREQQSQKQAQCLQGTEGELPPGWTPCLPTSEHLGQHKGLARTPPCRNVITFCSSSREM